MSIDWISRARQLKPRISNLIGGRWVEGRGTLIEKRSPRDGARLCRFGTGEHRDAGAAVESAKRAFEDGRWSLLPVRERREILLKLALLIEEHREQLALLECVDVGKPISDAIGFDVPASAATIRFAAEAADKVYGKVYSAQPSTLTFQLRRPLGVVAGIIGWNFPLLIAAGKIGPALAAGNCLVLKPSELTSLSATRLAELALQAGVPEGVLNVVHGGAGIGAALAHDQDVDLITFTGSTRTGKELLIASGKSNMKRLILECGGKSPNIVFEDCPNLDAVADAVVARAFWNQGQVCTASSRLLVQESVRDEVLERVIKRASLLSPGDPLKIETRFGAVVSDGHKEKILSYVRYGEQEGAHVAYRADATIPVEGGFYISPVIFDRVLPDQKIAREEIFGPVLAVLSFRDEREAIALANATIYGLSAILWTRDLGRAYRMSYGIKAGWTVVNATATPSGGPAIGEMAIGGHKESGIGVEGGTEGLIEYTSSTAVQYFV